ncbi:hypothetical protein [Cohnella sp.]|uniref:hypothetical protein n=1 Tax=Cohnella sp. TaxID=1883426 RepID=UPI0035689231
MIVFCEYFIPEQHRAAFTEWAMSYAGRWQGAELLENTGQAGVFVEIWPAASEEEAAAQEKERLEGRSWLEMEQWIKGGREGLRIWIFSPVFVTGEQA